VETLKFRVPVSEPWSVSPEERREAIYIGGGVVDPGGVGPASDIQRLQDAGCTDSIAGGRGRRRVNPIIDRHTYQALAAQVLRLFAAISDKALEREFELIPRADASCCLPPHRRSPFGVNFLIAGYTYTRGGIAFDPALPVTDPQLETSNALLAYARVLDLRGKSGKLEIGMPKTIGPWTLELSTALNLFGDNKDFFAGKRRRLRRTRHAGGRCPGRGLGQPPRCRRLDQWLIDPSQSAGPGGRGCSDWSFANEPPVRREEGGKRAGFDMYDPRAAGSTRLHYPRRTVRNLPRPSGDPEHCRSSGAARPVRAGSARGFGLRPVDRLGGDMGPLADWGTGCHWTCSWAIRWWSCHCSIAARVCWRAIRCG
jgi:hypothetical protein